MSRKDRKRADILDSALQCVQAGEVLEWDSIKGYSSVAPELQPLLDMAVRVRKLSSPQGPSPDFLKKSEARLRRRIKSHLPKEARRENFSAGMVRRGWLRTAASIAVVAILVLFVSGWGASSVSAQALPGDSLYPVKRGLEEASLFASLSAIGDVKLLAGFADERLAEVQELIRLDREADLAAGLEEYSKILSRLDTAMERLPSDSGYSQLDDLQTRLDRHSGILESLRDQVPQAAQPALEGAVEHSRESKDRVRQLRLDWEADGILPGTAPSHEPSQGGGDPSPTATETATPTATVTDTEPPTNTATPTPTVTPEPTKTRKPSKTPKPSKTSKLTSTVGIFPEPRGLTLRPPYST